MLVEGCLFDECYAKRKGGGVSHKNGNMSVLGSVFYGNRAGGKNIEHGEVSPEGKYHGSVLVMVGNYGDEGIGGRIGSGELMTETLPIHGMRHIEL